MTPERKIVVTEWSESKRPAIHERQTRRWFWTPAVFGSTGTLLLHSFALGIALLVSRAHSIPLLLAPEPSPVDRLVIVPATLPKTINGSAEALAWVKGELPAIEMIQVDPPPLLNLEPLALDEKEESESSIITGDGAERARLYAIYSRQIQARVERIWSRPRTPVYDGGPSEKSINAVEYFHCKAEIVQDALGNVQDIRLTYCNSSVAWQHSLVLAIQQASPLPAPPSPTVFSFTVALDFIGRPYMSGQSDEGYEPRIETAQATMPPKSLEEIAHEFISFHLSRSRGTLDARNKGEIHSP